MYHWIVQLRTLFIIKAWNVSCKGFIGLMFDYDGLYVNKWHSKVLADHVRKIYEVNLLLMKYVTCISYLPDVSFIVIVISFCFVNIKV